MKNYIFILVLFFSLCLIGCDEATKGGSNNTIPWDGIFFGTQIPQPKGYEKAFNIIKKDPDWDDKSRITVYIEGMKFEDYLVYTETLKALSGWENTNDKIDKEKPEKDVSCFSGDYKNLGIGAFYLGAERVKFEMKKNPKKSYNFYLLVTKHK